MNISIQQFQLRNVLKTETRAINALKKIKENGCYGIELNQFMLEKLPFSIRLLTKLAGYPIGNSGLLDWYKIVNEVGLNVVALHISLESLDKNIDHVIEQARKFDVRKVVITGMRHYSYTNETSLEELCHKLNIYGQKLSENQLQFMYHNHNCEFIRLSDGQLAYDYIVQHTDEQYVNFELDVYWACDAGIEIIPLMEQLGSRMKLLHINDRCYTPKKRAGSIVKFHGCEVGTGTLKIKKILGQALQLGLKDIVVETHDNWINNDPIESFVHSLNNISEIMNNNKKGDK